MSINEDKLAALNKLRDLLDAALEAHAEEGTPGADGGPNCELSQDLQKLSSGINISHLLLKWAVVAWESDGDIDMERGIKAIKLHIKATDSYAGIAKFETAEQLVKKILKVYPKTYCAE